MSRPEDPNAPVSTPAVPPSSPDAGTSASAMPTDPHGRSSSRGGVTHSGWVTEHAPGPPSPWTRWLHEHHNEFDPQDWVDKLFDLGKYRQ
jgi:hypothetical protein